jgi:hypothetical protein
MHVIRSGYLGIGAGLGGSRAYLGIVIASSNGNFVTFTEATLIASVTLLPLQRQTKFVSVT